MSVSVTLVRALVEEVARAGRDSDAFLRAAQLEPAILANPDARLPYARYHSAQELAVDLTGDAALGLHMGERASLSAFNMIGFLCAHCSTLRQAVSTLSRYRRLLFDVEAPELLEEGDRATLRYTFTYDRGPSDRMGAESTIAAAVQIGRMCLGRMAVPLQVEFEHPAPPYRGEYLRVLGAPVRFDSDATRLCFDRALLDVPLLHANPSLYRVLASEAERKLAELPAALLSDRVRAMVLQEDEVGRAKRRTMEQVARRLALSERSLRRRLRDEGSSYASVVEEAITGVARRLLSDRSITIQHVADQLGFSEPSAFHRAFKRSTGMTPQQFREGAVLEPRAVDRKRVAWPAGEHAVLSGETRASSPPQTDRLHQRIP